MQQPGQLTRASEFDAVVKSLESISGSYPLDYWDKEVRVWWGGWVGHTQNLCLGDWGSHPLYDVDVYLFLGYAC